MNLCFKNKRITGILSILPSKELKFEDGIQHYNFSPAQSLKLKLVMGYNTTRVVDEGVCVSDLCVYGLKYLFKNFIPKNEIDAIILVTQSPDYFMPPTTSIIHGILGLKRDMICLDINQGCAGYLVGLQQAFMLLEQDEIKKVALLNADVLSRKVSKKDRNSNPLTGDAASITIIENFPIEEDIFSNIKVDGHGADALMIPAGGFRKPSSMETAIMYEDSSGNFRSENNLVMKGDRVFNFVMTEVPSLIEDLLRNVKLNINDIDFFMFHQPNKFMLNKLADKLGIERSKMPNNIVENFGNSSSVTIPLNISYNLGASLCNNRYRFCLSGFGSGLTWSGMVINIGDLDFNQIIYF